MKLIDRYILKELVLPFFIGTVGLILVLQANMLIALFKIYNLENVPLSAIVQLLLFKTPEFLKQTLPAGVALATSMAFSRLVRESELTAMRSAGCSIRRALVPVLVFGIAASALSFATVERFQPAAERRYQTLLRDTSIVGTAPTMVNNVMLKLGARGTVYFSSVARKGKGAVVSDVMIVEQRGGDRLAIGIAHEGTYQRGLWSFPNMLWREFEGDIMTSWHARETTIDEQITLDEVLASQQTPELTLDQLKVFIDRAHRVGADSQVQETEYWTRFALPVACMCFAMTGSIMSVLFGKSGGFAGIFVSIVLVMVYLNAFVISTEILARNHWVSPIVGAWLPDIIFLVLGFWGLKRLE